MKTYDVRSLIYLCMKGLEELKLIWFDSGNKWLIKIEMVNRF